MSLFFSTLVNSNVGCDTYGTVPYTSPHFIHTFWTNFCTSQQISTNVQGRHISESLVVTLQREMLETAPGIAT